MRARTTTAPMAGGALKNRMKRVKQPPSQRLSEKVSGSGWGGIPQRAQRAQRIIGWGECSYIGAVWCNCCGLKKGDFSIILPQNAWIKVLTLPTPMAKSKTPPRPLRPLRESSPSGTEEASTVPQRRLNTGLSHNHQQRLQAVRLPTGLLG